jgi:HSP20 family molecular chaperone IbpA
MTSQEIIAVPLRTADTILDEIDEMYEQITRRAYEIFRRRGGICTLDLEDWLTAERELLWKPDVRVEEKGDHVIVTICVGNVRPLDLQLVVTPQAMVIQAQHASAAKRVFRTLHFPRRIDVNKAEARYCDGCLILTA